jgi:hypothetical protein
VENVMGIVRLVGGNSAAALLALAFAAPAARAAFIETATQVGGNVVFFGSGSLNTSALFQVTSPFTRGSQVHASVGFWDVGQPQLVDEWGATAIGGITGPAGNTGVFGTGGRFDTTTGTGSIVGVASPSLIELPDGYVSDAQLSNSGITFAGRTFATMGLTPGTYTWSWGSGATFDSITLQIGAVPEPSTLALMGSGILPLFLRRAKRNAK